MGCKKNSAKREDYNSEFLRLKRRYISNKQSNFISEGKEEQTKPQII